MINIFTHFFIFWMRQTMKLIKSMKEKMQWVDLANLTLLTLVFPPCANYCMVYTTLFHAPVNTHAVHYNTAVILK
jgi:hypothetical protein